MLVADCKREAPKVRCLASSIVGLASSAIGPTLFVGTVGNGEAVDQDAELQAMLAILQADRRLD